MSSLSSNPMPAPQEQAIHILIVEDNASQRLVLAEWLRSQRYIVREAATTDEATMLLASPHLPIDLVIADVWLPGLMDGANLAEYIRYAFPEMPVIMTSGVYKQCKTDALTAFFQKPYAFEDISLQITKMLGAKKKG
jgi:two-component system, response regulator PdtaR